MAAVFAAPLALPGCAAGADAADPAALLGAGGCVIALRHARAPGTFDPPAFRVDDCRTQRNLDDQGRDQARRIGTWFRSRGLVPARVRSSPWCRCVDTAELAFGRAERWDLLGSPRGSSDLVNARRLPGLRAALAAVPAGRFEAWVTHNFVLAELAGGGGDSGEGLVLRASADGAVQVIARLPA
jgi:hypothetical protein